MSSNIKILKVCEYCKNEFIAKKTTSKPVLTIAPSGYKNKYINQNLGLNAKAIQRYGLLKRQLNLTRLPILDSDFVEIREECGWSSSVS
jgi:hypothetical protein